MKLYIDARSHVSRPLALFMLDEERTFTSVDLANPSHRTELPGGRGVTTGAATLVDGGLVLNEVPTILRYLADRFCSRSYPLLRMPRARIDAAMDWISATLTHALVNQYLLPQLFPEHGYASPVTQSDITGRGLSAAGKQLDRLDDQMRAEGHRFICGAELSLADYLASGVFGLADESGFDFSCWPRVRAWLRVMKSRPNWVSVYGVLAGSVAAASVVTAGSGLSLAA